MSDSAETPPPRSQTPGDLAPETQPGVSPTPLSGAGPTPALFRAMPTSVPSGIPKRPASPAPAPAQPAAPAVAAVPKTKAPEVSLQIRARSRLEQWEQILTSTPALYAGVAVAGVIFVWTFLVIGPRASEAQVVMAREKLSEVGQRLMDASALAAVDQVLLSNQVVRAERFLIQRREDFVGIVSDVERLSKLSGWKPELTIKPANDRLSPADTISVYPVTLRISPNFTQSPTAVAYQKLVSFLDRLDQIPQKVEVVALSAQGDKGALAAVQLELHFWVKKSNEKPAAK